MSERPETREKFEIDDQNRADIGSIIIKVDEVRQVNDALACIEKESLYDLLTPQETKIVERILAIDPTEYGFKGPYVGTEPVPDDLVRIEKQPYMPDGRQEFTTVQFVPRETHEAYREMAGAMEADLGRPLMIDSGYRSDAYQAILFLQILQSYEFDVQRTAKRVAIPGYSEHLTPSKQALDFQNIDGMPTGESPQDFEHTVEFGWLKANANNFGFHMSYPRDNPHGVVYEPWHWRHVPQVSE
jgi:LAS superfamily LD-carboxypeptidase LdcB